MITAIALDDEALALRIIASFCERTGTIQLVKTFTNSSEARKYLLRYPVDLIFLDINMPAVTGIDFYKSISQDTQVIFTTAYSEYAVEGFNVNATDYLLKPFKFERFEQAIKKAKDVLQIRNQIEKETNCLYIRADYSLQKTEYASILFVEAMSDYLRIHRTDGKPLVTRMTLKSLEDKLPADSFLRVHRSYIIAIHHVNEVRGNELIIREHSIPVSRGYWKRVKEIWLS